MSPGAPRPYILWALCAPCYHGSPVILLKSCRVFRLYSYRDEQRNCTQLTMATNTIKSVVHRAVIDMQAI